MGVTTFLFAQTIAPKKCNTCGKPLAQCQYKGKHPKTTDNSRNKTTSSSVTSEKETVGSLKQSVGYLSVMSDPVGATVYIDNKNIGKTPLNNYELFSGKHKLKLLKDSNYEEKIVDIDVKARRKTSLDLTLAKTSIPENRYIDVTFRCTSKRANIVIDNKNYGSIQNKVSLKYGNHKINVTCAGYKDYESSILVDSTHYYFDVLLDQPETIYANVGPSSGSHRGYDYVDLGLPSGVKWATMNIGSTSPSDYGYFYAWGEVSPKKEYSTGNYFDSREYRDFSVKSYYTYYNNGGKTKILPNSGLDAARQNWKGRWRLPTADELHELIDNCTFVWCVVGGNNGYMFTSKNNGKSIFLPASGDQYTATKNRNHGNYMSSNLSPDSSNCEIALFFYAKREPDVSIGGGRYGGKSIRPVFD